MEYIEYLAEAVERCDTSDTEDLEALLRFLVEEAINYQYMATEAEKKLKDYITVAEYERWTEEVSTELFRTSVERSPSEEFRKFCEVHFEEITK